jgi:hypothetical protein
MRSNTSVHTSVSPCSSHDAPGPQGASSHEGIAGTQSGPCGTKPRSQVSHRSPAQPSSHVQLPVPPITVQVPCMHGSTAQGSTGPVEPESTTPESESGSGPVVVLGGSIVVASSGEEVLGLPVVLGSPVVLGPGAVVPGSVSSTGSGLKHAGSEASTDTTRTRRDMGSTIIWAERGAVAVLLRVEP